MQMNRRNLLKLVGVGTALIAGVTIPTLLRRPVGRQGTLQFRATVGLPERPLPSYATYVLEGSVNLASGTGVVSSRVMAGHPGAASEIGLPGLGQTMTVTGVEDRGAQMSIQGVIPGESHQIELVVDRARGVVHAPVGGKPVVLTLA